jgi:hypothetical protein
LKKAADAGLFTSCQLKYTFQPLRLACQFRVAEGFVGRAGFFQVAGEDGDFVHAGDVGIAVGLLFDAAGEIGKRSATANRSLLCRVVFQPLCQRAVINGREDEHRSRTSS